MIILRFCVITMCCLTVSCTLMNNNTYLRITVYQLTVNNAQRLIYLLRELLNYRQGITMIKYVIYDEVTVIIGDLVQIRKGIHVLNSFILHAVCYVMSSFCILQVLYCVVLRARLQVMIMHGLCSPISFEISLVAD